MRKLVLRFLENDSGATAIEYGLMHSTPTLGFFLRRPWRPEAASGHRLECADHDNKPNHDTDRR